MARLFSNDPVTRSRTTFRWDASDDSFILETKQDVTPCVELTRAEFNMTDERAPWRDVNNLVARIPSVTVEKLMRLGIWYDDAALLRWLDDPEHSAFRSRPGRLAS